MSQAFHLFYFYCPSNKRAALWSLSLSLFLARFFVSPIFLRAIRSTISSCMREMLSLLDVLSTTMIENEIERKKFGKIVTNWLGDGHTFIYRLICSWLTLDLRDNFLFSFFVSRFEPFRIIYAFFCQFKHKNKYNLWHLERDFSLIFNIVREFATAEKNYLPIWKKKTKEKKKANTPFAQRKHEQQQKQLSWHSQPFCLSIVWFSSRQFTFTCMYSRQKKNENDWKKTRRWACRAKRFRMGMRWAIEWTIWKAFRAMLKLSAMLLWVSEQAIKQSAGQASDRMKRSVVTTDENNCSYMRSNTDRHTYTR